MRTCSSISRRRGRPPEKRSAAASRAVLLWNSLGAGPYVRRNERNSDVAFCSPDHRVVPPVATRVTATTRGGTGNREHRSPTRAVRPASTACRPAGIDRASSKQRPAPNACTATNRSTDNPTTTNDGPATNPAHTGARACITPGRHPDRPGPRRTRPDQLSMANPTAGLDLRVLAGTRRRVRLHLRRTANHRDLRSD